MNPIPAPPTLQGLSLIGSSTGRATGVTFHAVNPATGAELSPAYHAASREEAAAAAELAGRAFAVYRKTTPAKKAVFLRTIADNLDGLGDTLMNRVRLESALPEDRCKSELARTSAQFRMFANLVEEGSWVGARIDHANPSRAPVPKPDTRVMFQALGPVAVFGPANFPLAYGAAGGDTASALAAGCPVVVKSHSSHPGTSELCASAILQAAETCGLPEGIFSLIYGSGSEIGPVLVSHPCIKAAGFTGSEKAGRSLFDIANARPDPIPVFAEMGSLNPVFLLPHALRERGDEIAAGLHFSVTNGAGQFCTKPGLILAEASEGSEKLARQLGDLITQTEPSVLLNRDTQTSYNEGIERLAGHKEVRSLGFLETANDTLAVAAAFQTSTRSFLRDAALRHEVFGPATLLVTGNSHEDLLEFARALDGHLTATIHGTEEDFAENRELIEILETKAGRVIFNGYPTGVEVCSSMNHSGPYPASTDSRFTSVGTAAILRFVRPVCYQNCPQTALPVELQEDNPAGLWRLVDNVLARH